MAANGSGQKFRTKGYSWTNEKHSSSMIFGPTHVGYLQKNQCGNKQCRLTGLLWMHQHSGFLIISTLTCQVQKTH